MSAAKSWWDEDAPNALGRSIGEIVSTWAMRSLAMGVIRGEGTIERFHAEGQFDGDVGELFKLVETHGGKVIANDMPFDSEKRSWRRSRRSGFTAILPHGFVCVSMEEGDWSDVEICTTDHDFGEGLARAFAPLLKKRGKRQEVYVLTKGDDGFDMSSLGAHGMDLERDNYTPEVLESYDHVLSDLQEKSPCGRVVIIEGPPGTGKTHLIRGMIQEGKDTTFVLLPPTMIEGISGPSVIQALVGWRRSSAGPIVFVLEDADAVLASRKFDNINAVNEILNLGDGILGAALDIRIVATTNTGRAELDSAITRDGRLCRHIEVGELDVASAQKVADRLELGETISAPTTLAELYGRRRSRKKSATTKKRAGF